MGDENYERLVERIAKTSGLEKEEIYRKVEAKRAKLSGLISREGAAQVIAAELGINFDSERLKINELVPGMKKANVVGKILRMFPVREFERNGRKGKVANMFIADETSNIKVVLWDVNHIALLEKGEIVDGDVIEISNGGVRENEIHLGSFSELKKSSETIENPVEAMVVNERNILDFKISQGVKTRAFIVQVFDPRFFEVCSQCGKKIHIEGENVTCAEHGKVVPEKRSLINIVIDDGTESIRSVLFHENVKSLGFDVEDKENLVKQKEGLLGKEMFFSGNVRKNKVFENLEFVIDRAEEINLETLIKELEAK